MAALSYGTQQAKRNRAFSGREGAGLRHSPHRTRNASTQPRNKSNSTSPQIEEGLVMVHLRARDSEAVLRALAKRLLERGCVMPSFTGALIEREREYPTGLETETPIALPHTFPEHCRRAALAVATLAEAVPFGVMGEKGRSVSVRLVFVPTVPRLGTDVAWMSRLVQLLRDEAALTWLLEARSAPLIARRLNLELLGPLAEE